MERRKNDIILKAAFEECFPDLLRFFYKDADDIFDMRRGFVFMDKELSELFPEPEKKGGSRFVDMLVKVFFRNGSEEWMLIHLEIQEQNDPQFPKRMFQYFYRIYDRYDVPVTAWAIFTGSRKPAADDVFIYKSLGTENIYRYNTYHILQHKQDELLAMNNPFALIVLAAQKALLMGKIPEQELAEDRLTIARALIQGKLYNNKKTGRFLFFLKTFLHIRDPEINTKFDKEISLLTGNDRAMGIVETLNQITREAALEEGLEKGRYEIIKNLLQNSDFDVNKIAVLAGVPVSFVNKVSQESGRE